MSTTMTVGKTSTMITMTSSSSDTTGTAHQSSHQHHAAGVTESVPSVRLSPDSTAPPVILLVSLPQF